MIVADSDETAPKTNWMAQYEPITASNNRASVNKLIPRDAGQVPRKFSPNEYCDLPPESSERCPSEISRTPQSREFRTDFSVLQWSHLSKSLVTTIRLHTSELISGEIELEKSLTKIVTLYSDVDKAAEFRNPQGLENKLKVWQVLSVVLKEYARAVAINIQQHAKGKYVRIVPAQLRNLAELYERNYQILFEGDTVEIATRELTHSKTRDSLDMLVEATRERSVEDRGKMPSDILVDLVNSIDDERLWTTPTDFDSH